MSHQAPRILAVADCEGREEIVNDLTRHGFDATLVSTGEEALASFQDHDVVFVDLDLAAFDGLTLCREIRKVSSIAMIAFASTPELDRVLALDGGCDDCVGKPYPSRELMARVRALLRRVHTQSQPSLVIGDLQIDTAGHEVKIDGMPIDMTRKEFELVHILAAEPERVFSRSELLQRVWEYDDVDAEVASLASRTIDTHLSSIRKKLGSPHWIITVRGVGFRFNTDAPPIAPRPARSAQAKGTAI